MDPKDAVRWCNDENLRACDCLARAEEGELAPLWKAYALIHIRTCLSSRTGDPRELETQHIKRIQSRKHFSLYQSTD